MRSDWQLVKHMAKAYSPALAREWQRLPFVTMPDLTDAQLEAMDAHVNRAGDGASRVENVAQHLLFDDFVIEFVMHNDGGGFIGREGLPIPTWYRITRPDVYARKAARLSPWSVPHAGWSIDAMPKIALPPSPAFLASARRTYERYPRRLFLEVWEGGELGIIPEPKCAALVSTYGGVGHMQEFMPTSALIMAAEHNSHRHPVMRASYEKMRTDFGTDVSNAMLFAAWLTQCPQYLVEETPIVTRAHRNGKPDPKPWTNDHLPRIIMLDPTDAPTPREDDERGGTHASPRPHQRRAHWAELRHPKFGRNPDGTTRKVFVRSSWVGEKTWVRDGARYRVLEQTIGGIAS